MRLFFITLIPKSMWEKQELQRRAIIKGWGRKSLKMERFNPQKQKKQGEKS